MELSAEEREIITTFRRGNETIKYIFRCAVCTALDRPAPRVPEGQKITVIRTKEKAALPKPTKAQERHHLTTTQGGADILQQPARHTQGRSRNNV